MLIVIGGLTLNYLFILIIVSYLSQHWYRHQDSKRVSFSTNFDLHPAKGKAYEALLLP